MEIIMGSETVNEEIKEEWIEKIKCLDIVSAKRNIIDTMNNIVELL
jgi:hypothetical protein